MVSEAQNEFDEALTDLRSAREALAALRDVDTAAMRGMALPGADIPPIAVRHCFMAICVLFDYHSNWRNACRELLLKPDFIRRLLAFDPEMVKIVQETRFKPYITHPDFNPEAVAKWEDDASPGCVALYQWVIAIGGYLGTCASGRVFARFDHSIGASVPSFLVDTVELICSFSFISQPNTDIGDE